MKLHLHAHCRTGPSSILPHAALLASSRGQLRAPCQPVLSPLWCHPGPPHAIRVWVHTNAPGRTGFPDLDILRCASAVCARLRQSARRLLKSPMCYYPSPLASRFSHARAHRLCHRNVPHASPRTPPRFTPATPVRPRGAPLREPPPTPPRRLHSNSICADTRRRVVRGARFRFLENATRARARLLRGWPGERSS